VESTGGGRGRGCRARAGRGGDESGGRRSRWGMRGLWESLRLGVKAFVNTKGVFSVSFKVSQGMVAPS